MAIPDYQFIKQIRQAISIRYASMRIAINFIKNIHTSALKIMHPLGKGQLLKRLLIGIISGTGSHEPRIESIAFSHAQLLRHCPVRSRDIARQKSAITLRAI
jgi:hypothetical protein